MPAKGFPFVDTYEQAAKYVYAKDHVVVVFAPGVGDGLKRALVSRIGLTVDPVKSGPFFSVVDLSREARNAGMTVEWAVRYLNSLPSVQYTEFDMAITPDFVPNDPNFGNLYGLHNTGQTGGTPDADMDVTEAWDVTGVGNSIVVAECDDGIDWTHPDLAANIWNNPGEIAGNGIDDDGNGFIDDIRGWDFNQNDNNPIGGSGDTHGTHVAGTIAAVNNNGIGISGAGRNTKLMPLRMYSSSGATNWMTDLANAIDYAWRNGAKVISVSYNIDGYTNALVQAIQRADAADVVYCNSAGNNNQLNPPRAAIRDLANNVIFVAASDHNDARASFSNYGAKVEIFTAGVNIYSTLPGNTYGNNSGTSMATPNCASVVAVIRAFFPTLTDRQALDRLIGSADSIPQLTAFIPNGKRANLNNALEIDTTPPAPVADLAVSRRASTVAEIQFRTSGDDGMTGAAERYDVRVSTSPITSANFSSAQPVPASVPSLPAGQLVITQAAGLWPGTTLYLGVKAIDNLGNESTVSSFGPFNSRPGSWKDDVEGSMQFTPSGTWAISTTKAHSGTKSWTDTPTGNYPNGADLILTQTGTTTATGNMMVRFWADLAVEEGDDQLRVEVSRNAGPWTEVGGFSGTAAWRAYSAYVPAATGDSLQIRFRLTSDASTNGDGAYVDDIAIVPVTMVYGDNMEGTPQFTGASPWALTTAFASSPTRSWTDSPAGNYGNNANLSLTGTNDILLSGIAGPILTFNTRHDLESGYDYLYAEASSDAGATWGSLGRLNGIQSTFVARDFALPPATAARLRFRLTSDGSVVRDGAYIDDIVVAGEPWQVMRSFSGNLKLLLYRGNMVGMPITMDLMSPGTGTVVETMPVSVVTQWSRTNGQLGFVAAGEGVYDLRFTIPGYLKRRVPSFNMALFPTEFVRIGMFPGDANGDNVVNAADVTLIQSLLGLSAGQTGYLRAVDVNGDGTIDHFDVEAAQDNLGRVGE